MSFLGNLIWLLCGGLALALSWLFTGIVLCVTIIGIPVGKQCFKFAKLSLCPFGKEIIYSDSTISLLCNIIWIILIGLVNAIGCAIIGAFFYLTIIGIPFGKQFFKFAKLWLMPFGAKII